MAPRRRLLLVGGGHAHLFVLEALAAAPVEAEVRLVSSQPQLAYSGMVPGVIAGTYQPGEALVDLVGLCRHAGATFTQGTVCGLDAEAGVATLADGTTLGFDTCSIAVGSLVAGLDQPGIAARALVPKPIGDALQLVPALSAAAAQGSARVVVVGGGAAGVELACAARARLLRVGVAQPDVTILEQGARLVPDRSLRTSKRVTAECARLGIAVRTRAAVAGAEGAGIRLADGAMLPADVLVWCAGAAAPPWLAATGLAVDRRGFLEVDEHLCSTSGTRVFAAGDVASLRRFPGTPKAGVFAVRQGPVLAANLRAAIEGRRPERTYVPQQEFLALLATGDGRAVLSRGNLVTSGRLEMRLKEWIDRRFITHFQRLAALGRR